MVFAYSVGFKFDLKAKIFQRGLIGVDPMSPTALIKSYAVH